MSRRRRAQHAENHERWLVSYADFITLLFAFFVVMFANSQVDREKVARISESVTGALESGSMTAKVNGYLSRSRSTKPPEKGLANLPGSWQRIPGKTDPQFAELASSFHSLTTDFETEIAEGKVQVNLTQRGLVVSMKEAAFFRPGDDTIHAAAYPMIEKLAKTANHLPNPLRMEGHTDSTPISNSRFKSNWELSAARSIAMMDLLTTRFGVAHTRVAIAGYADLAPVAANDTPENRARNRRVDIIILSESGNAVEPH